MKLFVANIEKKVTEAELRNVFTVYGEVATVQIVTDRATGKPKGFGFVEMPNEAEAQTAIDSIQDKDLGGYKLSVAQAKPRKSSS